MHLDSAICLCLFFASIAVILLVSIPIFYHRKYLPNQRSELYHDEDGTTTKAVQAAFIHKTRLHITTILLTNVLGLACNITAAILVVPGPDELSDRLHLLFVSVKVTAGVGNPVLQ